MTSPSELDEVIGELESIREEIDDMNAFELLRMLSYNPVKNEFTGALNGLWGETGTGKTKALIELAKMARMNDMSVVFFDMEQTLSGIEETVLKKYTKFVQTMDYERADMELTNLGSHDVVILDSLSSFTNLAGGDLEGPYDEWDRRKDLMNGLKKYAKDYRALVFLTIHESSGIGGKKEPRGGTGLHVIDNLFRVYQTESKESDGTRVDFFKWKSTNVRNFGSGTTLMVERVSHKGTGLTPSVDFRRGMKAWLDSAIDDLQNLRGDE